MVFQRTESPKWRAMRCRKGIFLVLVSDLVLEYSPPLLPASTLLSDGIESVELDASEKLELL